MRKIEHSSHHLVHNYSKVVSIICSVSIRCKVQRYFPNFGRHWYEENRLSDLLPWGTANGCTIRLVGCCLTRLQPVRSKSPFSTKVSELWKAFRASLKSCSALSTSELFAASFFKKSPSRKLFTSVAMTYIYFCAVVSALQIHFLQHER